MQVCVVCFKRTKDSEKEVGVAISSNDNCDGDVDVIIDQNNKIVPAPLWNYWSMEYEGCFVFDPKTVRTPIR